MSRIQGASLARNIWRTNY